MNTHVTERRLAKKKCNKNLTDFSRESSRKQCVIKYVCRVRCATKNNECERKILYAKDT